MYFIVFWWLGYFEVIDGMLSVIVGDVVGSVDKWFGVCDFGVCGVGVEFVVV